MVVGVVVLMWGRKQSRKIMPGIDIILLKSKFSFVPL